MHTWNELPIAHSSQLKDDVAVPLSHNSVWPIEFRGELCLLARFIKWNLAHHKITVLKRFKVLRRFPPEFLSSGRVKLRRVGNEELYGWYSRIIMYRSIVSCHHLMQYLIPVHFPFGTGEHEPLFQGLVETFNPTITVQKKGYRIIVLDSESCQHLVKLMALEVGPPSIKITSGVIGTVLNT